MLCYVRIDCIGIDYCIDPCNSDQSFLEISPKLAKIQSSIIMQKKRNFIWYLG